MGEGKTKAGNSRKKWKKRDREGDKNRDDLLPDRELM